MRADPFFFSEVVALAARLRSEHYAHTVTLKWSVLTDAQKVPWIVKAHNMMAI